MYNRSQRRRVKLREVGGSYAVTVPKKWLRELNVSDSVDLVQAHGAIMIEPPREADPLEDEPAFAAFLDFLARDAVAHPTDLVPVSDLTAGDAELFADVDLDD